MLYGRVTEIPEDDECNHLIATFVISAAQSRYANRCEPHMVIQANEPGVVHMGVSDPEIQKRVFGPRWQHEIQKQSWPLWKKLIHRLQRCPICKPTKQARKTQ
jgi:hypothetical protein